MSAALVTQLVRCHYRRDDMGFASAASALARNAKVPIIRAQLQDLIRSGYQGRGPTAPDSKTGFSADRYSAPEPPKQLAPAPPTNAALVALPQLTFEDLLLDTGTQLELDNAVTELEYAKELASRGLRARNRFLFHGPPGNGKCLQIGTLVMRFDGSIAPVEAIRAGELLMGPDSHPRRVLSTTRGTGPLYRVHPVKGDPWVCNDVHVLTVVDTDTDRVTDIDVQRYLAASKWFRERSKLFTPEGGVDFEPTEEALPIDPYFLGVWYGDGTKALGKNGDLARVGVTKPDQEIADLMTKTAAHYGAKVRTDATGSRCPTHCISMGDRGGAGRNVLLNQLRVAFAKGDVLPHAYLTASREDRSQFLAGLLDTDGTDNYGGFEIVQKVRGYADGICFLARSLGLRATIRPKVVNGETYWRVMLSGECSALPLRIARKRAGPRKQIKKVNRTGFTLEPIGLGEYAGFELDGDGRFLLGDFTVTHNTSVSAALAHALGAEAYCVSISQLIGSHVGETGRRLGELFAAMRPSSVVVFDEIDAIGGNRDSMSGGGASMEYGSTVNALLQLLDHYKRGVIVATTNRVESLDPALRRRFDEEILFPDPTPEQIESLSAKLSEKFGVPTVPCGDCRNFDEVTKRVEREARRMVMRELIEADSANDDVTIQ